MGLSVINVAVCMTKFFFEELFFAIILGFNFFLCLVFIYRDLISKKTSYFVSYVFFAMSISYVISPFFVYYFDFGLNSYHVEFDGLKAAMLHANVVVFLFLIGALVGFYFPHREYSLDFRFHRNKKKFIVAIFAIVCFSFWLFLVSYGGLEYVINNISRIRSGTDDNKNYFGAFARLFTCYIEFLVLFFYVRFFNNKGLVNLLVFLVVFSLGLMKLLLDGGRGGLINLFVGILFVSIYMNKGRLPVIYMASVFFLSLAVGIYGKVYLFQIFGGVDLVPPEITVYEKFEKILQEYSHQYYSLVVAIKQDLGGVRYFEDLYVWLLKPLKLFGVDVPDSISYYNTYKITGVWDSEVPPGVLAFSYYQGGVFFVAVAGVFFGFLIKNFNSIAVNTIKSECDTDLTYPMLAIISIYLPFAFLNSDPALFIQWIFAYLLLFGFMVLTRNIKFRKFDR